MARDPEPNVPIDTPVAEPPRQRLYDYYVAPQRMDPSPLHEVAASLAPLSNDLFSLAQQQQTQKNQADSAQGTLDGSQANTDALANGSVPHDKSPAYMNAFGAQAGLNDALRLHQSIGPDYTKLDKTTSDPQAFDKWFFPAAAGQANPALKNNPGYAKAFGAGISRLHSEMSTQYVADRSNAIKEGAQQEFTAALGNTVNVYTPVGPNVDGLTDTTNLSATLNQVRQQSLQGGMDKKYVDQSTIDTVATKAIISRNPDLLNTLRQMPQDPNDPNSAKLGDTEYGTAKIADAQNTIKTSILQDRERWITVNKAQDEVQSKAAQTSVVKQWTGGNLNYVPTPEEMATIQKTDPLFPSKLATIREGILKGQEGVEDPQAVTAFMAGIMQNGGTPADIINARAAGVIKTEATLKAAYETVNSVEKYNQSGGANRIVEDPAAKRYIGTIEGLTANPKWAQNIVGSPRITQDGQKAINDFTLALMQHSIQNPNEGPIERQKFISQLGTAVVGGIANQDADNFQQHTYTTPQAVAPQLPGAQPASASPTVAPAAAPVLPPPAPSGNAPAGSPAAPGGAGTLRERLGALPAPPQFGTLPPDQQQQLTGAAQQMQTDPQALLNEMWKRSQPAAAPEATPGKQGSLETPAAQPVSFSVPGGGRVDLHGLAPDAAAHVQRMLALLGTNQQAGEAAPSGNSGGGVNQDRVAQMDALPVHSTIEKVAKETGMDPAKLKAMVSIESGGRSHVDTGSYHGLLQLSNEEFAKYGNGGDINDPEDNLRAGVASLQDKSQKFAAQFGREPSPTELYLMHQQGEAGMRAHEANPSGLAWENMASTGEGKAKGDAWAKRAIWGNVPGDMRAQFGSVNNMTSAQFMAVWQHKLEGTPYQTALAQFDSHAQMAENQSPATQEPRWKVIDKNGNVKGDYGTVDRARKARDKFDNDYGGYSHKVVAPDGFGHT